MIENGNRKQTAEAYDYIDDEDEDKVYDPELGEDLRDFFSAFSHAVTGSNEPYVKVTRDLFKSDLTNKEKYVYLLVKSKCVTPEGGKQRNLFNMSKQKFCDQFGLDRTNVNKSLNSIAKKGFLTKDINKIKRKFGTSATGYKLNRSEINPQKGYVPIRVKTLFDYSFLDMFKVFTFLLYAKYFFNNDGKVDLWSISKESGVEYTTLKRYFKFCESKGIIKNGSLVLDKLIKIFG
jgi:hypothetical protein